MTDSSLCSPERELRQLRGSCWIWSSSSSPCAAVAGPPDFEVEADSLCGACMTRRPAYGHARSALICQGNARELIWRFKFQDKLAWCCYWRHGHGTLASACWAARTELCHLTGHASTGGTTTSPSCWPSGLPERVVRPSPDMLRRIRRTRPQAELNLSKRGRNIADALHIKPGRRDRMRGTHIVIVDDVLTTGGRWR